MAYMKFFRTLGISTFFIIIITGGLFVSFEIAMILLFISSLSVVYFKIDSFLLRVKSLTIWFQEFYFIASKYVHYIGWAFVFASMILRTFHLYIGDILMFLGFTLLFFHYIFSLTNPDNPSRSENRVGYSSVLSNKVIFTAVLNVGLAIFILSFMFMALSWPGGGALRVLGGLMLAFFYGFKSKETKNVFVNLVLSLAMGLWFIAYLFQVQHWPGRENLMITELVIMGVALLLVLFNLDKISKANKNNLFYPTTRNCNTSIWIWKVHPYKIFF